MVSSVWKFTLSQATYKNRRKATLTWLPKSDFFLGEEAAVRTQSQATIKPCRRPLRNLESHVI